MAITSSGISLGFICFFLLTIDVKHFYMCLSAIHISSLKCIEIICSFVLTGLFVFLLLNYGDSLYITASIFIFCKYLLLLFGFCIHFLKDVFWRKENFNFQKNSSYLYVLSWLLLFSKKLLSTPSYKNILIHCLLKASHFVH